MPTFVGAVIVKLNVTVVPGVTFAGKITRFSPHVRLSSGLSELSRYRAASLHLFVPMLRSVIDACAVVPVPIKVGTNCETNVALSPGAFSGNTTTDASRETCPNKPMPSRIICHCKS